MKHKPWAGAVHKECIKRENKLTTDLATAQERIVALEAELAKANRRIKQAHADYDSASKGCSMLRDKVNTAKATITTLTAECDAARDALKPIRDGLHNLYKGNLPKKTKIHWTEIQPYVFNLTDIIGDDEVTG